MKLPKYVQAWVDGRDGRAYYYLRRRGFPRVRLSGLPWSPSFMAAYEAAMSGPRTSIGAGRIKPGSVAAVVADYLDSDAALNGAASIKLRRAVGPLRRGRSAYLRCRSVGTQQRSSRAGLILRPTPFRLTTPKDVAGTHHVEKRGAWARQRIALP